MCTRQGPSARTLRRVGGGDRVRVRACGHLRRSPVSMATSIPCLGASLPMSRGWKRGGSRSTLLAFRGGSLLQRWETEASVMACGACEKQVICKPYELLCQCMYCMCMCAVIRCRASPQCREGACVHDDAARGGELSRDAGMRGRGRGGGSGWRGRIHAASEAMRATPCVHHTHIAVLCLTDPAHS